MVIGAALSVVSVVPALAGTTGYEGQPGNQSHGQVEGQKGYEGQPGNQANGHRGQTGYEGQPGNQSH